jgi:hypothetical protein
MSFPRTNVGGLSLSRMIIGSNWFIGWSHCTAAKDDYIRENVCKPKLIADILETFLGYGVDTVMGLIQVDAMYEGVQEAQQRTGKKIHVVSTPYLPSTTKTPVDGFDIGEVERVLDAEVARGAAVVMPHTCITDLMVDKCTREVRQMAPVVRMIRERNMIPGLSTHVPETIIYADETDLDVDTYISIFNSMGFLMQLEVDWTAQIIQAAKKPVMTIKPMAAGQLRPFQALTFSWNAIRPCDMVAVGTMSPKEAAECCEISLKVLEHHAPDNALQETRSKKTVKKG